jgi:hypothetical protein
VARDLFLWVKFCLVNLFLFGVGSAYTDTDSGLLDLVFRFGFHCWLRVLRSLGSGSRGLCIESLFKTMIDTFCCGSLSNMFDYYWLHSG